MDVREKLVEIVKKAAYHCLPSNTEDFHLNMFVTNLIANGVTVQEWVSVDERLPDDNGKLQAFLVCRNQPSATSGKVLIQTEFFTNTFSGIDNVTHWMPIPQPPKGE